MRFITAKHKIQFSHTKILKPFINKLSKLQNSATASAQINNLNI